MTESRMFKPTLRFKNGRWYFGYVPWLAGNPEYFHKCEKARDFCLRLNENEHARHPVGTLRNESGHAV